MCVRLALSGGRGADCIFLGSADADGSRGFEASGKAELAPSYPT